MLLALRTWGTVWSQIYLFLFDDLPGALAYINFKSKIQQDLLGEAIITKRNYPFIPKIKWRAENCTVKGIHDTQILEWGAYEFMRKEKHKFPKLNQLWLNYRLNLDKYDIYFLIGNLKRHPTSFMIITIFYFPKEDQKKTTINDFI